jgi:hypothetical protein
VHPQLQPQLKPRIYIQPSHQVSQEVTREDILSDLQGFSQEQIAINESNNNSNGFGSASSIEPTSLMMDYDLANSYDLGQVRRKKDKRKILAALANPQSSPMIARDTKYHSQSESLVSRHGPLNQPQPSDSHLSLSAVVPSQPQLQETLVQDCLQQPHQQHTSPVSPTLRHNPRRLANKSNPEKKQKVDH